ncbi:karyogamy protein [Acrodontium crateriforme]|uniref:Karyogamy protein n=1 Tax=Acrodontium crateriforme TaxID=150365 RepID=A0AAQ3R9B8_9PEZI|nr:karyogamy protein [Acrodontium crateriforme]
MAVSLLRPVVANCTKNNLQPPTRSTSVTTPPPEPPPKRRLAPGLSLRLRLLEEQQQKNQADNRQTNIGRISEEQIKDLEALHRKQVIDGRRRGRAWTGLLETAMPIPGGVRLDGRPAVSEPEGDSSVMESDVSSIISISDRIVASESEDDRDEFQDNCKYRMPDIGKTRLHIRTKDPLSPSPRHRRGDSTPTTPRTHSAANADSPLKYESPRYSRHSSADNVSDSEFMSSGLSRSGSIYTISRVSFTGQLSQLTSMRLPDANTLAKIVCSIPTAKEAAKTLADASEQINLWISKASDVLEGLNAEDDVEWAAAGGREGIQDVDNAVNRLERLVDAYVLAIEQLECRQDVADLPAPELRTSVKQMEIIIGKWQKVKETLQAVKDQVEIALEWEKLWYTVLGEIAQEMDQLNRLVFEMEEKRHEGGQSLFGSKETIDLAELETIVEDQATEGADSNQTNRFSIAPFSLSAQIHQASTMKHDSHDSNLLGLFARMQPMRASLDFLPMRLYTFNIRGNAIFPTACRDLEQRKDQLEVKWKKLESDAESLRKELGEDKWITVFRNAGRQALKMCESIERSYKKLKDGMDAGEQHTNVATHVKKTENYRAKKLHYGPAIGRVLAIIDRGVLDRLTVNGEVLRLQSEMKNKWTTIQAEMRSMDLLLDEIESDNRDAQLRESVSTVMSNERSPASSLIDTPSSSPASSIVGASRKNSFQGSRTPTPLTYHEARHVSGTQPSVPRISLLPSGRSIPRRVPVPGQVASPSSIPSTPSTVRSSSGSILRPARPDASLNSRPRWISVVKTEISSFPPLAATEPSPYAKTPLTPKTNFLRSSVHLSSTPSSAPPHPTSSRNFSAPTVSFLSKTPKGNTSQRKSSIPIATVTSPTHHPPPPLPARTLLSKGSVPTLRTASRMASGRRSSLLSPNSTVDGNEADSESPSHHRRSMNSLASGRRSSMLPTRDTARSESRIASGRTPSRSQEGRPRWRP